MGLFDVHAHLTHPDLAPEIDAVIARAEQAGVTTIISNGLNPDDNQAVKALAERFPIIKPAFGFYPVDAVLADMRAQGEDYPGQRDAWPTEEGIDWVRQHVGDAFAVGEIGLDGYWVKEPFWPAQEAAFKALVRIAMEADKVIIIHTRKREQRTFELLEELGATKVDWHCFGGRVNLARRIAERGHYLSIPANARRSESFTRMLETLPRTQVLLETDCPYLGPDKDQRNEPANVARTAAYAAELWKTDEASVHEQMSDNFTRLFGVAP
ncbi:MAG: TatD family hydrolase [Polyangiaceae bacterium]